MIQKKIFPIYHARASAQNKYSAVYKKNAVHQKQDKLLLYCPQVRIGFCFYLHTVTLSEISRGGSFMHARVIAGGNLCARSLHYNKSTIRPIGGLKHIIIRHFFRGGGGGHEIHILLSLIKITRVSVVIFFYCSSTRGPGLHDFFFLFAHKCCGKFRHICSHCRESINYAIAK